MLEILGWLFISVLLGCAIVSIFKIIIFFEELNTKIYNLECRNEREDKIRWNEAFTNLKKGEKIIISLTPEQIAKKYVHGNLTDADVIREMIIDIEAYANSKKYEQYKV